VSATTSDSGRIERGETLDELELGAWRGLLRTHAALSRQLDAELAAQHGLGLSTYEVLLFLADSPGGHMRMAELADSVLLSRSGLTRLVDRLVRDDLVERKTCPGDARGMNAAITAKGRERFAAARRTHLDGVRRRFLDHLSNDEMQALAGIWSRMGQDTPLA
jgi:DNA-binding MarR family transcriptional regulator